MNPFDVNLDPYKLYNIGTGLAAIDWTQNVLLDVFKNGENEQKEFIEECSQNSPRFEKPIKRQKIISFCYRNWETENSCIQRKSFISMLNALFVCEHFLHIVTEEGWYGSSAKVSPKSCFLFFKPCRLNDVTPQSALLTYLETKEAMTTSDEIDVQIIEAAFFLHLHNDLQLLLAA